MSKKQASHRRLSSNATLSPSQCVQTLKEPAKTHATKIIVHAHQGKITYGQAAIRVRQLSSKYSQIISKLTGKNPTPDEEAEVQDAMAQLEEHFVIMERAQEELKKLEREEKELKKQRINELKEQVDNEQLMEAYEEVLKRLKPDSFLFKDEEEINTPSINKRRSKRGTKQERNTLEAEDELVRTIEAQLNDLTIRDEDSPETRRLKLAQQEKLRKQEEQRAELIALRQGAAQQEEKNRQINLKHKQELATERRKRLGTWYWKRILTWLGGGAAIVGATTLGAIYAESRYDVREWFRDNDVEHLRPSRVLLNGQRFMTEFFDELTRDKDQQVHRLSYRYRNEIDFSNYPVTIDPGHGFNPSNKTKNTGSCGPVDKIIKRGSKRIAICEGEDTVYEHTLNLEFSFLLREKLRKLGIPTELTRTENKFVPNKTRNSKGPLFLSIHHDVPTKKEFVELLCPSHSVDACEFARHLQKSLSPEFGTEINDKNPRGIAVINKDKSIEMADQSVLIELGPTGPKARRFHEQQAEEIANAVHEYLKAVVPPSYIKEPFIETGIIPAVKQAVGIKPDLIYPLQEPLEDQGFLDDMVTAPDRFISQAMDTVNDPTWWDDVTRQTQNAIMVDTIEHYSWKYGIDPFLVYALRKEFNGDLLDIANYEPHKGRGFMRLTDEAIRVTGAEEHLIDQAPYNIRKAIEYLSSSSYGIVRWLENDLNHTVSEDVADAIAVLAYKHGEKTLKDVLTKLDKENKEINEFNIIEELPGSGNFALKFVQEIREFRQQKAFNDTGTAAIDPEHEERRKKLYAPQYKAIGYEIKSPGKDISIHFFDKSSAFTAPAEVIALAVKYGELEGVDPAYILGIIGRESAFKPGAIGKSWKKNNKGKNILSYGLMQLEPKATQEVGCEYSEKKLLNAEYNIRCGVKYLKIALNKVKQYERKYGFTFTEDRRQRLAGYAYNAGYSRLNDALARLHEEGKKDFTEEELFAASRKNISKKAPHRAVDNVPLKDYVVKGKSKVEITSGYMDAMTKYTQQIRQAFFTLKQVEVLSPNFTIQALEHSDTAIKKGIPNKISEEQHFQNARFMTREYLEIINSELGRVSINSGFRSPALNDVIEGASNSSDHAHARAVDFTIAGYNSVQLKDAIVKLIKAGKLPTLDQLIFYPGKNYVHIGVRMSGARGQVLQKLSKKSKEHGWYKLTDTVIGSKKIEGMQDGVYIAKQLEGSNKHSANDGHNHGQNGGSFAKPFSMKDLRKMAEREKCAIAIPPKMAEYGELSSMTINGKKYQAIIQPSITIQGGENWEGKPLVMPAYKVPIIPECFKDLNIPPVNIQPPTAEDMRIAAEELNRPLTPEYTYTLEAISRPHLNLFDRMHTPQTFIQEAYTIVGGKPNISEYSILDVANSLYSMPKMSKQQAVSGEVPLALLKIQLQNKAEEALLQYGHYAWDYANKTKGWNMTPTQARLFNEWGLNNIPRAHFKEKEGLDLPADYSKKSFVGWRMSGQTKQLLLAKLRIAFVAQNSGKVYRENLHLYQWGRVPELAKKRLGKASGNKRKPLLTLIELLKTKRYDEISSSSLLESLKTEAQKEYKSVLHGQSFELVHKSYRPQDLGEKFLALKEQELQEAFFVDLLTELNRQRTRNPRASAKELMNLATQKFLNTSFNTILKGNNAKYVSNNIHKTRQSLNLQQWWLANSQRLSVAENTRISRILRGHSPRNADGGIIKSKVIPPMGADSAIIAGDYAIGRMILRMRGNSPVQKQQPAATKTTAQVATQPQVQQVQAPAPSVASHSIIHPNKSVKVKFTDLNGGSATKTISWEVIHHVHKYATAEGINPSFAMAIAYQESGLKPGKCVDAQEGNTFTCGLFQLKPSAARKAGATGNISREYLLNISNNAKYGIAYAKLMLETVKTIENGIYRDTGNKFRFQFTQEQREQLAFYAYNAGDFRLNDALRRMVTKGFAQDSPQTNWNSFVKGLFENSRANFDKKWLNPTPDMDITTAKALDEKDLKSMVFRKGLTKADITYKYMFQAIGYKKQVENKIFKSKH